MGTTAYEIFPLTPERRGDFTELFGAHGAKIVEAYPMDKSGKVDDLSGYMGVLKPFLDEGFEVVVRRSQGHPVVRKVVKVAGKSRK